LYYETGAIDSRINLLVRDSDGSFFNSGKENARETELVNLDFSFVDSTGQTIRAFETIHIATSGDFGKSSIFVDVTPSNFVFIADETGTILNYDDLETLIQVYYGTQLLSPDISAGVPGTFTASFSTTNISISNITSDTTGITIGQFSNMVGNNASVEYDLIVTPPPTSIYKTESFNVSFTQNFSVVRGGSNSRSVNLSADTYIVIYDGEDNIIYPPSETITLQAQALNHTGSVYYQFLKNNVTQSAPSLQTIYDLSSLDIVESGETDIWSVRTRESETGPIVAVDSISIAGIKNGKDSRSVVLVASSNFVNYDGTGSESPIGQEILLTATPINHFGSVLYEFKSGSTTIQSGSTPTYVISSSYTQSTAPNIPVKPLFNESHVYSVFTREGTLSSPILSADAITISGIKAGTDSEDYAIIPLNGTAIKNSNPNTILEVKATYQGQDLSAGPYKLAVLSGSLYEPLSAASASGFIIGVQSGSLNTGIDYNATFNSQSISGSLEVFLVSGSSANGIEDSISLVDVSDGLGGGFVEATSLVFVRDKNNVYTPTTSSVTASFYQRGTFTNPLTASLIVHPIFDGVDKMKYVTSSVSPLIQIQVDDQDGNLVESDVESNTKDLNFVFLFTDPNTNQTTSVTETFFIVSDGLDGDPGLDAKVVSLSANSYVVSYDENESIVGPSSILLIASSSNFTSGSFKFEGEGLSEVGYTLGVTLNADTASIDVSGFSYFTTPKTYRVGVSEFSNINTEIASDTITIFAVKPGLPGTPGDSPIEYKIIPLSGSQIKNGEGTLELRIAKISGSSFEYTSSGDYKLASGSTVDSILSVGSGYSAGIYQVEYNPIITAEAISGSQIIYLITGSSGEEVVWDTITLVDVTDGLGGGSFLSSTLSFRRTGSFNVFSPESGSVTASFFTVGTNPTEYTASFKLFPSYSVSQDTDFMWFETGSIPSEIILSFDDGDGVTFGGSGKLFAKATKDIGVTATFTDPISKQVSTIQETYFIVSDGIDGADAYTVVVTNESHTLPADSSGNVSSFVGSGTRIIAYKGGVKLSGSLSETVAGKFSASVANQTNITATGSYTVVDNEIVFGNHSAMTADSASIEYTIFLEGTAIQVPKLQSFTKAKTGVSGSSAKDFSISLSSENYNFDNSTDTTATPNIITVTINQQNLSGQIEGSDISVLPTGQTALDPTPTVSGTVTNGTGIRTFDLSFSSNLTGTKSWLPVTITVTKDGIVKSTTIGKVEGGDDGDDGLQGPGLVYRGEWSGSTEYIRTDIRRDIVFYERSGNPNKYWIASGSHTSVIEANYQGNYNDTTTYDVTDVIFQPADSTYYISLQGSNIGNTPESSPTYWESLGDTIGFEPGSTTSPGNDKWEEFSETFTSVATTFLLTEDAVATRTISVGENASITIFGSGSNPYISIGQETKGFGQDGIFAGISNGNVNSLGTASLSLVGNNGSLSWDGESLDITGSITATSGKISGSVVVGYDGEGITLDGVDKKIYIGQGQYANSNTPFYAASGSSDIFSLGDKLRFNGSDLTLSGSIVATSGRISGSVVVGQTGTGITLDGSNNRIFIGSGIYNCSNTPFYVASGSTDVFSLGDRLRFGSNSLTISGSITADDGNIGGLIINNQGLATSDARLKIQSNPVEIEVKDSNDNTRFLTNTSLTLPNPLDNDSGTKTTNSCTGSVAVSSLRTIISNLVTSDVTKCTPFSSAFTPTITGRYSIVWNYVGSGNGNNEQCVGAGGVDSFASLNMQLLVTDASGVVVAGSSLHSVSVAGGEFDAGDIVRLDNSSTLSPRTFSITTNLVSGITYCLAVRENLSAYVLTPIDGEPFVGETDVFACVNSELDQAVSATYSGTNTYTIINGGGFQSVVGTGKFLSICDSVDKPSTTIMGGARVDAVYQCTGNYDGITFTNISSTTPSFNPIKAYVRFVSRGTDGVSTICSSINVDCVYRRGQGEYEVYFKCQMSSTNYGIIGTAEYNDARIINTLCQQAAKFCVRFRGDAGGITDTFCTATITVLG
jgi:hypothetical protein